MVVKINRRISTGWHLCKNAADNCKRVMAQSHDQLRTVRVPASDHHHRETSASCLRIVTNAEVLRSEKYNDVLNTIMSSDSNLLMLSILSQYPFTMRERERERERQTDRQTDRQTETERQRNRET